MECRVVWQPFLLLLILNLAARPELSWMLLFFSALAEVIAEIRCGSQEPVHLCQVQSLASMQPFAEASFIAAIVHWPLRCLVVNASQQCAYSWQCRAGLWTCCCFSPCNMLAVPPCQHASSPPQNNVAGCSPSTAALLPLSILCLTAADTGSGWAKASRVHRPANPSVFAGADRVYGFACTLHDNCLTPCFCTDELAEWAEQGLAEGV